MLLEKPENWRCLDVKSVRVRCRRRRISHTTAYMMKGEPPFRLERSLLWRPSLFTRNGMPMVLWNADGMCFGNLGMLRAKAWPKNEQHDKHYYDRQHLE